MFDKKIEETKEKDRFLDEVILPDNNSFVRLVVKDYLVALELLVRTSSESFPILQKSHKIENCGLDHFSQLSFSSGGRFIAFTLSHKIFIFEVLSSSFREVNIEANSRTNITKDNRIFDAFFSPVGDILAINTEKGVVFLKREENSWKELLQSREQISRIKREDEYKILYAKDACFTRDGKYLVVINKIGIVDFYEVNVEEEYINLKLVKLFEGKKDAKRIIVFSDNKDFALIDKQNNIFVYDLLMGILKPTPINLESDDLLFWDANYGYLGKCNWINREVTVLRSYNDKREFILPKDAHRFFYIFNNYKLHCYSSNWFDYFVPEKKHYKLVFAAQNRDLNGIEKALQEGADINAKDEYSCTPLFYFALWDDKEVCEFLISKGADINAKNQDGETPLFYVAEGGNKKICEFLISKGADVNAKNKNGGTPLFDAACRGHKEVCEFLISKGADVNAKNKNGGTPLFDAAWRGRKEVCQFLISMGADVNAKNQDGETPLFYASINGHEKVCEFLISKGADVNAKTIDGKTALKAALENNHYEIADYLRSVGAKG